MAGLFVRGTTGVAVGLAALALVGCNETVGPGVGAGAFEFEIEGAFEESGEGIATQGTGLDGEDAVWAVNLVTTGGLEIYVFLVRRGGRPGTGDYDLGSAEEETFEDGDWAAWLMIRDNDSFSFLGFSIEGTVDITSSSDERVAGRFDFLAVGFDPDQPNDEIFITVSGRFNAEAGVIALPD